MISVEDMKAQVTKIAELRAKEAAASQAKKMITEELEKEELKMVEMLEASDMTQFRTDEGLAYISYKTSIKVPKDEESRRLFFGQLKELGEFDQLITVNSMTLNSWYKAKFEEAREKGIQFEAKGLAPPEITPSLSFRRS